MAKLENYVFVCLYSRLSLSLLWLKSRIMCKRLAIFLLLWLVAGASAWACTSAVVSGRVTPDGRPLLWKHRDSSDLNNRIVRFDAVKGQLSFVGLVNGVDTLAREVWTGYNSAGFAVMNTASYNLKNDTSSLADREGVVMKRALAVCRTVDDFERLLAEWPRPIGVEANFGVIDAEGGAAYFEVNNYEVFRYDAADSPDGYLLRTNYSMSGRPDEGLGYIRYDHAEELFAPVAEQKAVTAEWLTGVCSRSFYHAFLGRDFSGDNWVVDQDFIPRYSTSASLVVEGVRPGESPAFTTMWTVLGYPPCSVVLPVWLGCNSGVPALLQAQDDTVRSPLCEWSNALKQEAFPVKRGSGSHYLHMARLFRPDGAGITQQLLGLEKEVYARSRTLLDEARRSGSWNDRRVERTLGDIEQQVSAFFQQILSDENR